MMIKQYHYEDELSYRNEDTYWMKFNLQLKDHINKSEVTIQKTNITLSQVYHNPNHQSYSISPNSYLLYYPFPFNANTTMDQWTSKLKKLLHIQKQPQNSNTSHLNNSSHRNDHFNESPQKSQSNFKFINQQNEQPRAEPSQIQIITETQVIELQQIQNFPPQKVNKSQKEFYDEMDKQDHQSDEDSLGYTENEWDQQTINFQLQDRMLDCLEDQKHANQYRQSLAQSSFIRKSNAQRLSKPERPPSPKQNLLDQLDIQKIVQEINPNSSTPTVNNSLNSKIEEKKPAKTQRRNRFSKYKKQLETNVSQQKSLFPHFSPEEQQQFDHIFKKKVQQLQPESNQTCDDYIVRVLNLKTQKKISNDQIKKTQLTSSNQQPQKCEKNNKKLSDESFEAVEEIKHLNLSQIDKKQQQKASQSKDVEKNNQNLNQLQNKQSKKQQAQNIKNQEASQEDKQVLLEEVNPNQQTKDQSQNQQNKVNDHQQDVPQNKRQLILPQNSSSQNQEAATIIPQKINQNYKEKRLPIIYSPILKEQKDIQNPFKKNNLQPSNPQSFGIKSSPQPIRFQTPRAKIQFNYVNQQEKREIKLGFQNQAQQPILAPKFIFSNQPKFERQNDKKSLIMNSLQTEAEERIPIFLQRLRRLISTYPNFYLQGVDLQKIRSDLKIILNLMRSAISVIQLLFKKMKIQRNKLHEPFLKIHKCKIIAKIQPLEAEKLNNEIWDFFINSGWENYQIEQIEFIKPKQKFKMRKLNELRLQEGLKMYNEFVNVYLNQSIVITKSKDEIKRYIRIRQKISEIVQYLRMISEDLYSYWLVDCHYPHVYYDFLQFLKLNNQPHQSKSDQIYAKLIQTQHYNDPLSFSIIGTKIIQKVQQSINSV